MGYMKTNTAVIGGGASGLTAAVGCSRLSGKGSVLIIEKQQRTGRKLLASGNGRCNITNSGISEKRYHGDKEIIRSVLSGHSYEDMCVFMRSLGVLLREESEGRVYPYSNQASTILDALRNECERLGAEEKAAYALFLKLQEAYIRCRPSRVTVKPVSLTQISHFSQKYQYHRIL